MIAWQNIFVKDFRLIGRFSLRHFNFWLILNIKIKTSFLLFLLETPGINKLLLIDESAAIDKKIKKC